MRYAAKKKHEKIPPNRGKKFQITRVQSIKSNKNHRKQKKSV